MRISGGFESIIDCVLAIEFTETTRAIIGVFDNKICSFSFNVHFNGSIICWYFFLYSSLEKFGDTQRLGREAWTLTIKARSSTHCVTDMTIVRPHW